MDYIYDEPLRNIEKTRKFEKYGTVYKLEAVHKKGSQTFYTFKSPGSRKIMVIPTFIREYLEFREKVEALGSGKEYEKYRPRLRKLFEMEEEDEFESETSATGTMKVASGQYRDIGVTLNFENGRFRLLPEFEIRQNNVFETGVRVTLDEGEET